MKKPDDEAAYYESQANRLDRVVDFSHPRPAVLPNLERQPPRERVHSMPTARTSEDSPLRIAAVTPGEDLVELGEDPDQAIRRVREARQGAIENEDQEAHVAQCSTPNAVGSIEAPGQHP